MNGEILRHSGCKNIFVQPASSDSGTALGAAMVVAQRHGDNVRNPLNHVYYGPGFTNDEILTALKGCKIPYKQVDDPSIAAADMLEQGKIIAWFQGRMEFGARALGGRSILANLTFLKHPLLGASLQQRSPIEGHSLPQSAGVPARDGGV